MSLYDHNWKLIGTSMVLIVALFIGGVWSYTYYYQPSTSSSPNIMSSCNTVWAGTTHDPADAITFNGPVIWLEKCQNLAGSNAVEYCIISATYAYGGAYGGGGAGVSTIISCFP